MAGFGAVALLADNRKCKAWGKSTRTDLSRSSLRARSPLGFYFNSRMLKLYLCGVAERVLLESAGVCDSSDGGGAATVIPIYRIHYNTPPCPAPPRRELFVRRGAAPAPCRHPAPHIQYLAFVVTLSFGKQLYKLPFIVYITT